tara:strand:+ start:1394 stop:1621 length:228 start_codon:yes stop_codon:yes gene_type:complete
VECGGHVFPPFNLDVLKNFGSAQKFAVDLRYDVRSKEHWIFAKHLRWNAASIIHGSQGVCKVVADQRRHTVEVYW